QLSAIVARALSPQPEQRFESAAQMGHALEVWLASSRQTATAADVGRAVRTRLGDQIARRRAEVRSALQAVGDGDGTRPVWSDRGAPAPPWESPLPNAPLPPPMRLLPRSPVAPPGAITGATPSGAGQVSAPPALQGMKTVFAIAIGLALAITLLALRTEWIARRSALRDPSEPGAIAGPARAPYAAIESRAVPVAMPAPGADGDRDGLEPRVRLAPTASALSASISAGSPSRSRHADTVVSARPQASVVSASPAPVHSAPMPLSSHAAAPPPSAGPVGAAAIPANPY
ncbi:MAG: hypothetical protein FWD17_12115, partial [Polyangiaceae bacterium]|nr:hypothetical protein [Polyangiaceae bacterium]